ncbi:Dicer-1 [Fasciola hepatica]|uniref:Dicer-1 n=1 Tax=Fasciola hepatica TaxID=6192 RepID=A0A4E0R8B9_FASHE|nr:Dicer-1 [Fasciola hepatica]
MIFRRDVKHRIARRLLENVPNNHFLPYPFQLDLLDTACKRNTIMCLSNEVTKNFIIVSLIRETQYDNKGRQVIYFTQDKFIPDSASCIARHTGLDIADFTYRKPYIDWMFPQWIMEICRHDVIVISPWLFMNWLTFVSDNVVREFFSEHVFLLFVSECHHVLEPKHPYFELFGPRGLQHFGSVTVSPKSNSQLPETYPKLTSDEKSPFRIVCFTSALLPREMVDPKEAERRLLALEHRTGCRLETASELLTMLSLGARPKERVIVCNQQPESDTASSFHRFVIRILAETSQFLHDVQPAYTQSNSGRPAMPAAGESMPSDLTQVPDSRGRLICVLDYCRRAVSQCETILNELGVWCAAQIARVFVKHLIGLDRRRSAQLAAQQVNAAVDQVAQPSGDTTPEHGEDQLARILRFTYTQLCIIVRLFQVEFDRCLTLETLRTMISPKILMMVDQLKSYKPSLDFRIEVAELPGPLNPGTSRKARRRRNRSQSGSQTSVATTNSGSDVSVTVAPLRLLSADAASLSDSSVDTMSSLSDADEQNDRRSVGSRTSLTSRNALVRSGGSKSRSRAMNKFPSVPKARDLHFVPASSLVDGGLRPGMDPSQLVYRAVLTSSTDGDRPQLLQQTKLCGLVLVRCQFTAYALSRLIDELCVWDVDLFFIKPGHLFSHQTSIGRSRPGDITNRSELKTGDDAVTASHVSTSGTTSLPATQEETISKFRRGSINLLVATQPAVSAAAGGAELPRCNLVVALQPPHSLAEYLSSKARSRLVDHGAQVVYLIDANKTIAPDIPSPPIPVSNGLSDYLKPVVKCDQQEQDQNNVLERFQKLEQLLIRGCRGYSLFADEHDVDPAVIDYILPSFMPRGPNGPKLLASKAINVINQFCARLPSDYITNLTPRWRLKFVPLPVGWKPPLYGPGASCGLDSEVTAAKSNGLHQCVLRLPINTSIKDEIEGEPMACKKLAKLSAAFNAVRALYAVGELDSRWEPSTRDPVVATTGAPIRGAIECGGQLSRSQSIASSLATESDAESELSELLTTCNPEVSQDRTNVGLDGSSRRRRYYYRKFPDQLSNCFPQCGNPSPNYLYYIDMELTNVLPDYQNARGRPCYRPEDEPLGFGLLTTKPLHHIPTFPIFSRSGEETVRFIEFWSPSASVQADRNEQKHHIPVPGHPLTEEQLEQLVKFHRIVFQEVLHLEHDAVIEFNFEKAYTQLLVVPVRQDTRTIDWDFMHIVLGSWTPENVCRLLPRRDLSKPADPPPLSVCSAKSKSGTTGSGSKTSRGMRAALKARQLSNRLSMDPILNQPGVFEFRESDFVNAVVMPGYRNLDQPQHYYVAEIRYDLSPLSPFPTSTYSNFAAYYMSKYDATISTVKQPLLDVDFTVMRLSLIVPRYVNIRGHYLPCSSEARKRDRRENLTHKQILIPELCFRHPFPASVWRKAVCLPSVLYRLHCLLLAEELRRRIAFETSLGRARLPSIGGRVFPVGNTAEAASDSVEVFEPLRVIFPLEVQRAVQESRRNDSGPSSGTCTTIKPRRRRRRAGGGHGGPTIAVKDPENTNVPSKERGSKSGRSTSSKQMNSHTECKRSPSSDASNEIRDKLAGRNRTKKSTDGDDEDCLDNHIRRAQSKTKIEIEQDDEEERGMEDDQEEVAEDSDEAKTHDELDELTDEPQIVKLHATSGPVPSTHHNSLTTTGLTSANLEALLEETKVIEWDEEESVAALNPDSDHLIAVGTRKCADQEYFGTDSDVESVDSFEGNVRFFPSEDDCEVDDQTSFEHSEMSSSTPGNETSSSTWTRSSHRPYRPGPANVLQALTMSSSNDFINLERMETIGDSFLKFVVTVHLYLCHPTAHEGKLSHLRSRIVCNSNLYRLGRAKNLPDRMIAGKFGPGESWVPPGYIVCHDRRLRSDQNRQIVKQTCQDTIIWSTDSLMNDEVLLGLRVHDTESIKPIENFTISDWDPNAPEVKRAQESVDRCLITIQQAIPDKSVADCVEALIGCYLTARGERSALRLMRWFGIDCLPGPESSFNTHGAPWVSPLPNIRPPDPRWTQLAEARLVWRFNELEEKLHYTFKDPSLLIQAFTHPSYHQLRTAPSAQQSTFLTDTDCYQRLEFLGDAVLDYVITRFLYEDSTQHSPGVLTDLRSALVNNNIFAALAVRIGLHVYLRASSPQLLHTVDTFVRYQKEVAKDDLDFITNEDIEIRQPDPDGSFGIEPTTDTLATPECDSVPIAPSDEWAKSVSEEISNTPEGKPVSLVEPSVEEDMEEESAPVDAGALGDLNEKERKWAKDEAEKLVSGFMNNGVTLCSDPNPRLPRPDPTASSNAPQSKNNFNFAHRFSDDVEIPKALGDIFESLAGAIFLDSGMSLDTVWTVFYPLMKERIERYTACIPKSPVRQLLELEPEGTKFERPRRTADGRISVCAHVLGKGRFYGIGRNYRLAKSLAAKRALRVLRKLQETTQNAAATTTSTRTRIPAFATSPNRS